jgi:hypothetical protein
MKAYGATKDGEYVIDMDQVADQVAKSSERPSFYYAEVSQQNHYTGKACGEADDILGWYGYCSCCGTRNDLQELELTIEGINGKTRERLSVCIARPEPVQGGLSTSRLMIGTTGDRGPAKP